MASHTQRGAALNAHTGDGGSSADVWRQTRRLGAELNEIGHTTRQIVDGCRTLLGDRLRHQPYVVLAAAAGVGYVLGGGLPRGLVRGLLVVSGRLMLETAVARVVGDAAQSRDDRR